MMPRGHQNTFDGAGAALGGKGFGKGAAPTAVALTSAADSVGASSNDLITATAATLNAGDSLVGGAGMDVISLSGAGTFDFSSLAAFSSFERIQGDSTVGQTLILKDGVNVQVSLGSGANTLIAGSGSVSVDSHGGADVITGGSGALNVRASAGTLTVTAGSGGSHVDIGDAAVTLTAGSGVDVIDLGHGAGSATVTGFAQGVDKIEAHHLHVSSYAELLTAATISSSGGNTTITVADGGSVTLVGVAAVSESDFSFGAGFAC